jgi:hypothetical protein
MADYCERPNCNAPSDLRYCGIEMCQDCYERICEAAHDEITQIIEDAKHAESSD